MQNLIGKKKQKMRNHVIILKLLLVLFLTPSLLFALELKEFQEKIISQPLKIPQNQSYSGTVIYNKSHYTYPFTMSINVHPKTDEVTYIYKSKELESSHNVNNQFTLLNALVTVKSKEYIKAMKMDQRKVSLTKRKERLFQFYLNKELKKEKEISYTSNTVDATTLSLFLQNALYHNITDFYCDFVVEQLPMGSRIKVTRFEAENLLEIGPQYTKPNNIQKIANLKEKVIYFETAVQGIGAIFYPHKHYYIYQSNPPYRYIGTWGGPSDRMVYQFIAKNIPHK
jgi:hypothetical protein